MIDDDAKAALMARLSNQFGDLDVVGMLADGNKEDTSSDDSSIREPSQADLMAWQQSQFDKGREKLQAKKLLEKTPLEKRRLLGKNEREEKFDDTDDWEDILPQPDLQGQESLFFPSTNNDEGVFEVIGIHPLLMQIAAEGDPEVLGGAWKRLYSSSHGDGLSFSYLLDAIRGYGGPTIMFIRAIQSAKHCYGDNSSSSSTLGFYTTSTWVESSQYYGTEECFLFSIGTEKDSEEIRILRPKEDQPRRMTNNYMYCHPSSMNIASRNHVVDSTNGAVHGIGIGGTAGQPRLHITESMEGCRALGYDTVFEPGQLLMPDFGDSLYYFDIDYLEVWGVGGQSWIDDALLSREKERARALANLQKVQRVDKEQLVDDLRMTSAMFKHQENTCS